MIKLLPYLRNRAKPRRDAATVPITWVGNAVPRKVPSFSATPSISTAMRKRRVYAPDVPPEMSKNKWEIANSTASAEHDVWGLNALIRRAESRALKQESLGFAARISEIFADRPIEAEPLPFPLPDNSGDSPQRTNVENDTFFVRDDGTDIEDNTSDVSEAAEATLDAEQQALPASYGFGSTHGEPVNILPAQYHAPEAGGAAVAAGASSSGNARAFSEMLDQHNQLQQQTAMEKMEMEKAQAFWNPLESMSKRDATS